MTGSDILLVNVKGIVKGGALNCIFKRILLTNQKKTIVSICLGKNEIAKCAVEKYTFFYIIALV